MIRSKAGRLFAALLAVSTAGCAVTRDNAEHAHHADSATAMPEPTIPQGAMFVAADVKFMQGMIAHHGQAVEMAKLAPQRSTNTQLLKFTNKIDLSQQSEIELMRNWLLEREQAVPDSNSHHHMSMPGMLTPEQLKELEKAKGKEFDRLFLLYMIQHHEGALRMVEDLRADPMALQDYAIMMFANDVDADQRAEILKMHQMLDELK